jgi:hypothetical protein
MRSHGLLPEIPPQGFGEMEEKIYIYMKEGKLGMYIRLKTSMMA